MANNNFNIRNIIIINLDPANDYPTYDCDIDLSELITVKDVMDNIGLGPNGAMIYCMEYLEQNIDWLIEKMKLYKSLLIIKFRWIFCI